MTERDHWSIGEVLALVQEDFPDVTISKIRFLESKGLITPERTASGYRRFHPADLERLRWVLSQQRDNYLPLKVIRHRLASGDLEGENEAEDAPRLQFGDEDLDSNRIRPRTGKPLPKPGADSDGQSDSTAESGVEDGSAQADGGTLSGGPSSSRVPGQGQLHSTDADAAAESNERAPSPAADSGGGSAESSQNRHQMTPRMERRGERRGDKTNRRVETIGANAAMTKDELAESSGCSVETIIALERFGLLSGRTIGPTVLYDTEALRVATIASKFVELGLEPRHLRTFKIDAEREVSLLTQVVEPLFYGKNEKARLESLEALDALVQLSADLREILVRQMVREQLPSHRG